LSEDSDDESLEPGPGPGPLDELSDKLAADLIRDITADRLVKLLPLNPTQTVVVALVNKLPVKTYHIIIDNLFSSPNLFKALRIIGVGATGTCCISCGLYYYIADLKEIDRKG
jgi:hypothetical protein